MTTELQKLRRKDVVLTVVDSISRERAASIAYELHRKLRVPHWNISVSPHKPEDFHVRFDFPEQRDAALPAGTVYVGTTTYLIQPWRLEASTRPTSWFFHAKICVEHLPTHVWMAEGVKRVLGDVCIFDHMEAATFIQECTEIFSFAWLENPDLLPRSRTVTLFSERAGRSPASDGPPPPEGREVTLLIHLDHYNDWTPCPATSSSSAGVCRPRIIAMTILTLAVVTRHVATGVVTSMCVTALPMTYRASSDRMIDGARALHAVVAKVVQGMPSSSYIALRTPGVVQEWRTSLLCGVVPCRVRRCAVVAGSLSVGTMRVGSGGALHLRRGRVTCKAMLGHGPT
jgi:hypothetical protein